MRSPVALLAFGFTVAAVFLAVEGPAAAQSGHLEISPFAGYRWDGQISSEGGLFASSVDVDDSSVFGVRVDFPVTARLQVELLASHQSTRLLDDDGFFAGTSDVGDVDVDALHLGVLLQRGNGQVLPYGVFSVGATRLAPSRRGHDDDAMLSASGGGGVKVFLNRHFGLRLEARLYWIDTDESDDTFSTADLVQKEATGGVIFAF